MAVEPRQRAFTVDEYQRLGQAGIIGEHERVELIEGRIVEMNPLGPDHI
jgi:Uma2 family endonuclease